MSSTRRLSLGAGLALFVTTVVTLMLGATTQDMPGHDMSAMNMQPGMMWMDMTEPLAGLQGEDFEVAFMSMMIAHHRSASEMAQWILERTDDAEIRDAAQTIIEEQDAEIEQMTGWLQEWYGRGPDAEMMGTMQSMMAGMMDANDPDQAFLEGMSEHHNGAIDMAQPALFEAVHPELRALAENIIVTQAREVAQFQTWLAEL